MDRFQAMKIFVRVVEAQSFAAAARELGSSPPAVTRAVAFLEEITGARLLTRTTRSVTLTEPGANYYDDCKRLLGDLEEAEAAAGGADARGRRSDASCCEAFVEPESCNVNAGVP